MLASAIVEGESDQDIRVERITRKRPRDLTQDPSTKRIKTCDLHYNLQVLDDIVVPEESLDDEEERETADQPQSQEEPQDPFLISKSALFDDLTTARSCVQGRLSGTTVTMDPVRLDDSYAFVLIRILIKRQQIELLFGTHDQGSQGRIHSTHGSPWYW